MMTNRIVFAAIVFVLSGCATVTYCPGEKALSERAYKQADKNSKYVLLGDLRGGKLKIGAKLDYIRETYGDPDDMLVARCAARLIYKLDSGKNITLWFEDGLHLTMWSD